MINHNPVQSEQFSGVVKEHIGRRPLMELCDIYKLVYQGILGAEHLITDPIQFAQCINQEWQGLTFSVENETITESIRPDGQLWRINLRPYKTANGSLAELIETCLLTAQRKWGTPDDLRSTWESIFITIKDSTIFSFSQLQYDAFTEWLRSHGYPAMHHSQKYRTIYKPAYRLIDKDQWMWLNRGS